MKKEYIKPSMEATAIEAQAMIAASGEFSISDKTTESDASMAGERRGGWGDLWGADK